MGQRTVPDGPPSPEPVDAALFEGAKDLVHTLTNTVSAMKIFPGEHATVKTFVDQLGQKFEEFLAAHHELQIGIEEYSFTLGGKPLYTDTVAVKSLPFFFFKDGLQLLTFYPGFDRREIQDFLELIKAEAQKPSEDGDIVAALWERDFPNIQYYAPEEFLEDRIMAESRESRDLHGNPVRDGESGRETIEVRVDASKFSRGRIDLDAEDRAAVETRKSQTGDGEAAAPGAADGPGLDGSSGAGDTGRKSPAAAMDPTLTEAELHALEAMVRTNRTISAEEEYINLMVEIVFLEENEANCRATLDALLEYHFDQLQRGNFHVAVFIIQKVHELGRHMAGNPAKTALLEEFLKRTVSPKTIEAVKILMSTEKGMDWEALLGFFALLGPPALPLSADLFDIAPDGEARKKVVALIEKTGGAVPGQLASLADNSRPGLSREIIRILAGLPDRRGIPHLSAFLNFQNKAVRLEALRVLGLSGEVMANRIVAGFLKDPDEDVRIQAALTLDPGEGTGRVEQVIRESSGREFQSKSLREKKALMSWLGRTRSAAALDFLRRTLQRAPLLGSQRALEMRLAAVAGLESMRTEAALAALHKGALGRPKRVREACQAALARHPSAGEGTP